MPRVYDAESVAVLGLWHKFRVQALEDFYSSSVILVASQLFVRVDLQKATKPYDGLLFQVIR